MQRRVSAGGIALAVRYDPRMRHPSLLMMGTLLIGGSALALGTLGTSACGSSAPDSEFGSSGSSGASGTSGASGSGTSGGFGTSSGASGGASGGPTDGAACLAPVDMFIMFDRSGSMGNDGNIGTTTSKWTRAITALSGYFNSMGATGQAAAIQFFPLNNHNDNLCGTGNNYHAAAMPTATPEYTTLPSNTFDALLNSTDPSNGGGTPTEAAIRGLSRFTAANRRPGKVTIGILITDGNPNGCNEDLTDLSNLLQAHHTATTIRTYVIGMEGADFDNLEEIAAGGGTPAHPDAVTGMTDACGNGAGPCKHWNVGDGNPAAFTAALAAIQESADGCKPGGGTVNPPK